jgi:hypothetical protein
MEEDLLLRDNFQRLLKVLLPEQQAFSQLFGFDPFLWKGKAGGHRKDIGKK